MATLLGGYSPEQHRYFPKMTPGSEALVLSFEWETKTKRENNIGNPVIGSAWRCKGIPILQGIPEGASGWYVREW